MQIRFGPAGNSESFYAQGHKSTLEQFPWLADMGLTAYEYSFGHGVRITEKTARAVGECAAQYDIALSIHAPYYVNLATQEEEKRQNSVRFLLESARAADWMGADRVVFHPGVAGTDREAAFQRICEALPLALEALAENGLEHITLCPETMGKISQIGDLDETIAFCKQYPQLTPCIDFGHLQARTLGELQGRTGFIHILDALQTLGDARASRFHVHFSRIEFTKAGEKKHWTYADRQFGPDFEPLAALLVERQLCPRIICESKGTMAEDAVIFRDIYAAEAEGRKC